MTQDATWIQTQIYKFVDFYLTKYNLKVGDFLYPQLMRSSKTEICSEILELEESW